MKEKEKSVSNIKLINLFAIIEWFFIVLLYKLKKKNEKYLNKN